MFDRTITSNFNRQAKYLLSELNCLLNQIDPTASARLE
jgi:hypothetical protein